MDIVITITDTQYKGLQAIAVDPQGFIQNFVEERARVSNDEIVQKTVAYCLDNGVQVPATREEVVAYAFENGIARTLAEVQAEKEAEYNVQG